MNSAAPDFTLLTRADCRLCSEMRAALHAFARGRAYACDIRDVDERADWRERWGERIPVLLRGDRVIWESHPDAAQLEPEFGCG